MTAINLNKVRLGVAPLGSNIMLYRHGKDPHLALDKREAEFDVLQVITQYMVGDAPKGASKQFTLDGKQWYELSVIPIDSPKEAQE